MKSVLVTRVRCSGGGLVARADAIYAGSPAGAARSGLRGADRDVQDAAAGRRAAWRRRSRSPAWWSGSGWWRSARCRASGSPRWCTARGSHGVFDIEIPGVIAKGQQWKLEWQVVGNNADGILTDTDGGLLLAQNDNGAIVKLVNGKVTTIYRDLNTSGAMSKTPKGALFVVERGLHNTVRQLAPQNRIHANTFNGDPLDCLGGVINDLTADSKGGVYFTHGGLFYADAKGVVTRYGENLRTNGVVLSPDEKTLYVTNGDSVAAFDVQANGSLTNQRVFVMLPTAGGDGLTVDSQGRLYITAGPRAARRLTRRQAARHHSLAGEPDHRRVCGAGQEDDVRGDEHSRCGWNAERGGVFDSDDRAGIQGARRASQ